MTIQNHLNYSQYLTTGISTGDNLLGFEIDMNAHICCIGIDDVHFIEQERTDDKNCMLILRCRFPDEYNYHQIADFIEDKWLNKLCYRAFEKHHFEQVGNELIFYYITRSEGLGVTGKVIIS